MMLTICDHFDVNGVLQLGVGRNSRHGLDVELGLTSTYAL